MVHETCMGFPGAFWKIGSCQAVSWRWVGFLAPSAWGSFLFGASGRQDQAIGISR